MPKKTTILIVVLVILTGILIFLAIKNEKNKVEQKPTTITPTSFPTVTPFASLMFSARTLDLSDSKSTEESVDVVINTNSKPVFGAQVELSYDPEIITDITISNPSGSFFGSDAFILFNDVDEEQGRVSYAISLPPQAQEKSGQGVVVKMNFKINNNKKVQKTSITFLPKSMITSLKSTSTVLEQTSPLSIILSK